MSEIAHEARELLARQLDIGLYHDAAERIRTATDGLGVVCAASAFSAIQEALDERDALRLRVQELEGAINTHFEALDRHDKSNDGFGKSRETYAEAMGTLADLRRAATKTMEGER